MEHTTISYEITETFTLEKFAITTIRLTPKICAEIDLCFYANNGKIYNRTFTLIGEEYLAWETDEYLFHWVQNHIGEIFGVSKNDNIEKNDTSKFNFQET